MDVINEITRLKRVVYFLQRRLSGSGTGDTTIINNGIQSIVEGTNITVNNADPQNPIISASAQIGSTSYTLIDCGSFTAPNENVLIDCGSFI